jgi:hypothetical protein
MILRLAPKIQLFEKYPRMYLVMPVAKKEILLCCALLTAARPPAYLNNLVTLVTLLT